MIGGLVNAMKLQARLSNPNATTRMAQVTSFDPNLYAAKCVLLPDAVETGWLPVASQWVGAGWGLFSPPSIGDWVILGFAEGDIDAGMVLGRVWTAQAPAQACPSGEFWLVHQSGSLLKFLNNGNVQLVTQQDLDVTVNGNLNSSAAAWNHAGPLNLNGNLKVTGAATVTQAVTGQGGMSLSGNLAVSGGNVTADGIDLKSHVHSGVQGGSGMTGGPQG